ncbi:hypothetical protein PQI07_22555 [Methylobacterium sp. 092160098-2]|uniref:hypothetical protein n=1 Tax=Methylobacterium sp. 092160098-2 TaxID=3025129 RepID=UPI002381AF5F|nr:hypothetical protein [Methylobacterium sp. 092160098-2]MDE4913465.1 hypothetical protein [Methylobacterium sp. 092160098-2]
MTLDRIHIGDEHALNAGRRIMALAGGAVFNPEGESCIARFVDGSFVGGVVYSNATQSSLQMHVAGVRRGWLNRDLLWVAFDFPFNQLGLRKVFTSIRASNTEALRFNASLGFKDEAVLTDVYPEGDMVIRSMYKADCRFLNIVARTIRSRGVNHGQTEGTCGS